jgi:hypothetical protein
MAKQKRAGSKCVCHPETAFDPHSPSVRKKPCKYGWCNEWRCVACSGFLAGFGPLTCRCDGAPRWAWHTGMAPGVYRFGKSVALKPSIAKRRR